METTIDRRPVTEQMSCYRQATVWAQCGHWNVTLTTFPDDGGPQTTTNETFDQRDDAVTRAFEWMIDAEFLP